jgi:nifR3 family TIM-barrel protein
MVSSEALIRGGVRTELLLPRATNEKRYAIQLFGANPEVMYQAALLLAPWAPEAVDINCGCPVPKVVRTGAGSALMRRGTFVPSGLGAGSRDPDRLGRIVEAVVRASREALGGVPVTVKMRTGWDSESINYRECGRIAVEAGAALVGLHARTRAQGYTGKSDWSCIADLVSRLNVPVAGSGDLFSPEDAERMLRETGCAAVMFARGAMGNPFIFANAKSFLTSGSWKAPAPEEKLAAAFRQLTLLVQIMPEGAACREMRKQFCAYTKGMAGGAALRNRLIHAETIGEYRAILSNPY